MTELAVCILTFNRIKTFKECVNKAIRNIGPGDFDIFVWDNNSLDGTVSYLKGEFDKSRIKNIFLSTTNVGVYAYNHVFEYSDAPLLLELDDDAIPPYLYGRRMVDTYRWMEDKYGRVGMLGVDMTWSNKSFTTRHAASLGLPRVKTPWKDPLIPHVKDKTDLVPGTCRMTSRKCWDEIGGQPKKLYGTDTYMNLKTREAGFVNGMLQSVNGQIMRHFNTKDSSIFIRWKLDTLRS